MASSWVGSKGGLLLTHLTNVPGPGSKSRFLSSKVIHVPADDRNCLITTKRAPAVPKNLILSAIFKNAKGINEKSGLNGRNALLYVDSVCSVDDSFK